MPSLVVRLRRRARSVVFGRTVVHGAPSKRMGSVKLIVTMFSTSAELRLSGGVFGRATLSMLNPAVGNKVRLTFTAPDRK